MLAAFSYVRLQRENCAVGEDLEKLKQRLSLLDYLRQQNWVARPPLTAPSSSDSVPCIQKTRASFYVNARKNLFYCHGCGTGRRSPSLCPAVPSSVLPRKPRLPRPAKRFSQLTRSPCSSKQPLFYQQQLDRYLEALRYLEQRGLRDLALIKELRIGYAPGGACAGISPLKVILAISCNVSACLTHKAATLSTGASSSRAAEADVSLTSTAAVPASPSPIDSYPLEGWLVMAGNRFNNALEVILVEGLFDLCRVVAGGFSPRHLLVGHAS